MNRYHSGETTNENNTHGFKGFIYLSQRLEHLKIYVTSRRACGRFRSGRSRTNYHIQLPGQSLDQKGKSSNKFVKSLPTCRFDKNELINCSYSDSSYATELINLCRRRLVCT